MQLKSILPTCLLIWFCADSLCAAPIDFVRDIRPIFEKHCYSCHAGEEQESGLRLDIKAKAFAGGDSFGPSIIPGHADQSPLVQFIDGTDKEMVMPPDDEPLSPQEISLITKWVNEGAKWPAGIDPVLAEDESSHWSFQPMVRVELPSVKDSEWPRKPLDHFILSKLEQNQLTPNPETERTNWLRRAYFTVTGLPPTPEQVNAFLKDTSEQAKSKVVDELLASPRYGERWAQHWLDVIRWAETVGFETNLERKNAWHYRDWVIQALNNDIPYDDFLRAQLTGDLTEEDAALGFLVAGPANLPGQIGRDEQAMREARQDELDEVIRTVGQGFFGLTIGCARCHNHKFDPIKQTDYYSLQAIFSGLSYGERRLRGSQNNEWTAQVPSVRTELKQLEEKLESLRQQFQLQPSLTPVQSESFNPVQAVAIRMNIQAATGNGAASLYEFEVWSTPTEEQKPSNVALASSGAIPTASSFLLANQTRHFDNLIDGDIDRRQAFPWVAERSGPAWFQIEFAKPQRIDHVVWHNGSSIPVDYEIQVLPPNSEEWITVTHTRNRLPRVDDTRKPENVQLSGLTAEEVKQIYETTSAIRNARAKLSRLSAGPQTYAASFTSTPKPTWLLGRGDAMKRLREVPPAVPTFLEISKLTTDAKEVDRRIALANHLTNPEHPLTARVITNRVWQHFFGTGIVNTPSDFGKMGEAPSHPELLDWLALDLIEHGWSLKHLHRQILLSRTFGQSSQLKPNHIKVDAESRLLWRFPPRRLEAEAIRDTVLAVSGKLNLKMGGPGFDFFNQRGGLSDYKSKETFDSSGWRRMVYAHKVRMQEVDIFGAFDCPDAGQMKPKRSRSITPIQSLSLLNSPFLNRQAQFFAERIKETASQETSAQIDQAFQLAFSRNPNEQEREKLTHLANRYGLEQVCRVIFNTREFMYLQ